MEREKKQQKVYCSYFWDYWEYSKNNKSSLILGAFANFFLEVFSENSDYMFMFFQTASTETFYSTLNSLTWLYVFFCLVGVFKRFWKLLKGWVLGKNWMHYFWPSSTLCCKDALSTVIRILSDVLQHPVILLHLHHMFNMVLKCRLET